MYKKPDNIFVELEDSYLMKFQYKDKWYETYIDKEDYNKVAQRHWRASHKKNKVYVVSGSIAKNNTVYLHNYILNYVSVVGLEIDHLDGNSLNNRKVNLKIVSRLENIQNTQVRIDNKIGIRGICQTSCKTYKVDFSYNKIRYYFPAWKTLEEAVYCRKFAEEYFHLNILGRNPLAQPYLNLSSNKQQEIQNIVIDKILRK